MRWIATLGLIAVAIVIAVLSNNSQEVVSVHHTYPDGSILIAGRSISFELADSPEEQALGLSGREQIEENQGMLFIFPAPTLPVFWMKDMKFAIDIVWIKGAEVIAISENAQPEPGVPDSNLRTYTPGRPADRVLELKAGWASRNGLKVGDLIEITQVVH